MSARYACCKHCDHGVHQTPGHSGPCVVGAVWGTVIGGDWYRVCVAVSFEEEAPGDV